MSSVVEHLTKVREERAAREKARIEKLREINLKKYQSLPGQSNVKPASADSSTSRSKISSLTKPSTWKNNFHVNNVSKKPSTIQNPVHPFKSNIPKFGSIDESKLKTVDSTTHVRKTTSAAGKVTDNMKTTTSRISTVNSKISANFSKTSMSVVTKSSKPDILQNHDIRTRKPETRLRKPEIGARKSEKVLTDITRKETLNPKLNFKSGPSSIPSIQSFNKPKSSLARRKSVLPETSKSESVFDRLYKPKHIPVKCPSEVEKLKTDPSYLRKVIKNSQLILNKRLTIFEEPKKHLHERRSISAIHFRRISAKEKGNCMTKWASIGDGLDKPELDLDEPLRDETITSSVKTERKRVKFCMPSNYNTPNNSELQARLTAWLQKRGKSLSSYHHLQCFGVNHLRSETPTRLPIDTLEHIPVEAFQTPRSDIDEENKENVALDSDSDDGSYVDTMNEPPNSVPEHKIDVSNWRNVSLGSESVGFNETVLNATLTPMSSEGHVEELLVGTLNDLSKLLQEGLDWQLGSRLLRSVRSRFPQAHLSAAYWECRAALEDCRGDLPASLLCWEEAVAKGSEHSVVDANLDQLLDKFMELKINPDSGAPTKPNPKLVDVKNVFKSTIIRFAVQQAKMRRQSELPPATKFTITPVRRSNRLSHCAAKTPVRICNSVKNAALIAPQHIFTPNENIVATP